MLRELEHFWNSWCSRRDDIVLIVCGSAASWMLKRIVHARGSAAHGVFECYDSLARYTRASFLSAKGKRTTVAGIRFW